MIRPYLRGLINDHKPTTELTNRVSNNDSERGEWKIQLLMQSNCISTRDFGETRTLYSASKPSIGFLIHFYKDLNKQYKHQMKEEADLLMKVLLYFITIFREQTVEEVN